MDGKSLGLYALNLVQIAESKIVSQFNFRFDFHNAGNASLRKIAFRLAFLVPRGSNMFQTEPERVLGRSSRTRNQTERRFCTCRRIPIAFFPAHGTSQALNLAVKEVFRSAGRRAG